MEITHPPPTEIIGTENKRHGIRIKARIKIHSEQESPQPARLTRPPYQAYCETVTSRPQSPDVFTTPPTHSEPFQPLLTSKAPSYTARITTRKRTVSKVLTGPSVAALSQHESSPTESSRSAASNSTGNARGSRYNSQDVQISTNRYHTVSQSANPRSSISRATDVNMSRNHTPSLSQVQQANTVPKATPQTITARTPLRQKRYGRMEYHPLPPLPPTPPDSPVDLKAEEQPSNKTNINFSRVEVKRRIPQLQKHVSVPHLSCVDKSNPIVPRPQSLRHSTHHSPATAKHERSQSRASRRTVTFADDMTLSSRSSSPDHFKHSHQRSLRQSKSFTSDAQVRSSLRLCRSHDSLLLANYRTRVDENSVSASRRTTPKDFKHKYTFGQRPAVLITPSPGLGRTPNPHYNPRLSTSKAQYRGLASLPRPLPSSLRVTELQTGPRQPPWGSLEDLEEQRGKRVDARERDQAKQFRAATLSEATTVGADSTDGFGKEAMKREVEGYRKQVVSVYPDMAFDGNAGKGGRKSCCCAVM